MKQQVRIVCVAGFDFKHDHSPAAMLREHREGAKQNLDGFQIQHAICADTQLAHKSAKIVLEAIGCDASIEQCDAVALNWANDFVIKAGFDPGERRDILDQIGMSGDDASKALSWYKHDPRGQIVFGRMTEFLTATGRTYAMHKRTVDLLVAAPALACAMPAIAIEPDFPMPSPADMVVYTIEIDGDTSSIILAEMRRAPK